MDLYIERLNHLKSKGFEPKVIYDIGAYIGEWTKTTKTIFPDAEIFVFEANEEHKEALQTVVPPEKVCIALLGDVPCTKTFYSRGSTGDSIYPEQTQWYVDNNSVVEKCLNMIPIDTVISTYQWPHPDFVKIDCQSAELLILKGGTNVLYNAQCILLEMQLLEYNKGGPTFCHILEYLDEKEYVPLDVTELHYLPTGELNEIDILFVKKQSPYIKRGLLA